MPRVTIKSLREEIEALQTKNEQLETLNTGLTSLMDSALTHYNKIEAQIRLLQTSVTTSRAVYEGVVETLKGLHHDKTD